MANAINFSLTNYLSYSMKHGVFTIGEDVMDAFDMVDTLSKSAAIYMFVRCMVFIPDGMSQQQMKEISTVLICQN